MSVPQRVLLIRTSSLGDVVHALPALTALRRAWPHSRIGWVVEEAYLPLLDGHPDLDVVLPVALRRWARAPFAAATIGAVAAFLDRLAEFGAEVAFDLMGNHKGGILSAFSFAPRRIGAAFRLRREPESAIWINEPATGRGVHAVDRHLAVLAAAGIPIEPVEFGPEKLFRRVDTSLPAGVGDAPFAFIHPGAAWGNKCLPPSTWGEIARELRERTGLRALVGAAPGEEGLAAAVAACGPAEPIVAGSLPSLAGLLRRARICLGGDTGPMHLARALGIPVVCVMGPTDPVRHGPYRAPESVVSLGLPCAGCHRRMNTPRACLLGIAPTAVAERAKAVLGLAPAH